MSDQSFSLKFVVDRSPDDVFSAINRVSEWWSGEVEGGTEHVGEVFTYTVPGVHYSQQKIAELVPGVRIVWQVTDANLTFVKDKAEWTGTKIVFDISKESDQTEVRFTHQGLVPDFECHEACSNAWGLLVGGNLRNFILTGNKQPSPW